MEKNSVKERLVTVAFIASCQFLGLGLLRSAAYEWKFIENKQPIICEDPRIQWVTCFKDWLKDRRDDWVDQKVNREIDKDPIKCTPFVNLGCGEYVFGRNR